MSTAHRARRVAARMRKLAQAPADSRTHCTSQTHGDHHGQPPPSGILGLTASQPLATAHRPLALRAPCSRAQHRSPAVLERHARPSRRSSTSSQKVTNEGSADFVPEPERIATFDNDGTLWVEHPMYTQLVFALDRVKAMAPEHPEWKTTQPFQAVLDGDMKALAAAGEKGLLEIIVVTHAGMTTADFTRSSATGSPPPSDSALQAALHRARLPADARAARLPARQRLQDLHRLRRRHRVHASLDRRVYGIPPEQVVGSSIKTKFEIVDGKPELIRLPEINFVDDKAGKPVGINEHIGRRPIFAARQLRRRPRNAAVDDEGGDGARLGMIVHHTDAEREYAYDRDTEFGRLDKALDAATGDGWTVFDMKDDWKTIFPPE